MLAPVVPPAPPKRPSLWSFATGAWQSLPNNPLPTLTARTVTFRLTGTSEASFTIDANLPEMGNINEQLCDLWIAYRRQIIYRGRIGPGSDTYDGNSHTVQFGAADYRAVLGRRILYDADTKTWNVTDQAQVFWNLINQTQGKSGGALGIVRGSGQTSGVNISPVYEAGATVQETIDGQASTTTGYDWDVEPLTSSTVLHANIYRPRGTDRGKILQLFVPKPEEAARGIQGGGNIASFTRQADPSTFANALRATGGSPPSRDITDGHTTNASATVTSATANFTVDDVGGPITGDNIPDNTTITARASSTSVTISKNATATSTAAHLTIQPVLNPTTATESGIGTDPAGRWDGQFADSDVLTSALLQSKADAALAAGQVVTPAYVVTLAPDAWKGPSDIWLGDPVTLQITSGYRDIGPETLRVLELAVTLDDESDAATVALTLGTSPPWQKATHRAISQRLAKLERR